MVMYSHSENFTKTPLANFLVYFSNKSRVSTPGSVLHRSIQFFQAWRYRQFLHIALVHDIDKDRGTLANSEPQTLWLTIKHSLNFSQSYKYH